MYSPPVSGKAPAISASVSAPQRANRPPIAQTASMGPGPGNRAAMPAGDRKIPEPMVDPTSTATALQRPRRRTSAGRFVNGPAAAGTDGGDEDGGLAILLTMLLWCGSWCYGTSARRTGLPPVATP